jgi:predicted lipoprotein with Yx(FWY)xxD motif
VSSSSFIVSNDDTVNDVSAEEEFNVKMTTAERNLKNALKEAAAVKDQKRTMKLYGSDDDDTTNSNMMNDNSPPLTTYDADSDGSDDWLRVLVEIRDDEEEFFEQRQEESIVAAMNGGDESMKNVKNDSGNSTTLSKDI